MCYPLSKQNIQYENQSQRLPRSGRKKIRLKKWATDIKPLYKSEKHYKKLLTADVGELSAL